MAFNRLNDLYFKQLLGDEKRKHLTLNFLNDILDRDGEERFTDIIFNLIRQKSSTSKVGDEGGYGEFT